MMMQADCYNNSKIFADNQFKSIDLSRFAFINKKQLTLSTHKMPYLEKQISHDRLCPNPRSERR